MNASVQRARRKVPFTFTPLPRTFFAWLPHLTAAELKTYLAIADETLTYNRFEMNIPMTRLTKATGLHRVTIGRAAASLVERGLLRTSGARKSVTKYEILTVRRVDSCSAETT